ncbi:MAG: CARDB domain-containing protein [bacterium]
MSTPLAAGASAARGTSGTVPNVLGVHFVEVMVDAYGSIVEGPTGEANNIAVSAPVTVVAADLVAANPTVPATFEQYVATQIQWSTRNTGVGISYGGCWIDRVFLSTDNAVDAADIQIATFTHCASPFAPGGTSPASAMVNLTDAVGAGTYFVLIKSDADGARFESNESNNVLVAGSVVVLAASTPDLSVASIAIPLSASIGSTFEVAWTIANGGLEGVASDRSWIDRVVLSANNVFGDADDQTIGTFGATGPLDAGASRGLLRGLSVPVVPGTYWVFIRTDDANQLFEYGGESNNVSAAAGPMAVVYPPRPDLVVTAITAPATATATQTASVSYSVQNNGEVSTSGAWRDSLSFVPNTGDGAPVVLGEFYRVGPIAAGATANFTETVLLPLSIAGSGRIQIRTDSASEVAEGSPARESNNTLLDDASLVVVEPALVDLVIQSVSIPASGIAGQPTNISWVGRNAGSIASPSSWIDRVYLSIDSTLGSGDLPLGARQHGGVVAAGGTWSGTLSVALPEVATPMYAIVVADINDVVEEGSGDANNATASPNAIVIAPAAKPNLVISITSTPSTWQAGQSVQVGWKVENEGKADADGPWTDALFLSTDATFSPDDALLRVQQYLGDLAPTAEYNRLAVVTLPIDYVGGARYLIARTDANGSLSESVETDNDVASAAFQLLPVPAPDLVPSALGVSPGTLVFGAPATFSFTETNSGSADATGTWSNLVLISTDATPSANDLPVALGGTGGVTLAQGGSVLRTLNGTLPLSNSLPAGNYYFIVRSDANASIVEQSDANNTVAAGPFAISRPPLPNLVVSVGSVPAQVGAGESFSVQLSVQNTGEADVTGNFFASLTADEVSGGDTLLQEFVVVGPIAAGGSKSVTRNVAVPPLTTPDFALKACVDVQDQVVEQTESDGCASSAVIALRRPNLVVTNISAPASAQAGGTVTVLYTVQNTGTGPASGFWTENVYLSVDTVVGGDRIIGSNPILTPLAAGASASRSVTATLPSDLDGPYSLVVVADASVGVAESDENDNARVQGTLQVQPAARPNLVVQSLSVSPTAVVGKPISVSFNVRNIGEAATTVGWVDSVYFSTNGLLDAADTTGGSAPNGATLAPGASYAQTVVATAPSTPGTYRIIAFADGGAAVLETAITGELDNTLTSAGSVVVSDVTVVVEALSAEVAYPASMPVRVRTIDPVTGTPVSGVPITFRNSVRGFPQDENATTGSGGIFETSVLPRSGYAGLYTFAAAPRGRMPSGAAQTISWGVDLLRDVATRAVPLGASSEGTLTIRNLGDVPLTGVAIAASGAPAGVTVNVFLPNGSVLAPNETRIATYTMAASSEASSGPVTLTLTSDKADDRTTSIAASVVTPEAALVASPTSVNESMLVGAVKYFNVTFRNLGAAPTGPLQVAISSAPWLSLASPASIAPLAPGEQTVVNVRLSPAENLPLGPYSAAPFVTLTDTTDPSVWAGANGVFTATSDAGAAVTIEARNEFSYYGQPPTYPNAQVEIRRSGQSALVAGGPVDAGGNVRFDKLEAGLYDIKVTAPQHGTFSQTRQLDPGETTVVAFLPRQLVSYQWSVVQVPFSDEYQITINLAFETNVPAPVITFDPVVIDFTTMTQPFEYRELRVTNHGLIAAQNLRIDVMNTPYYQVIPLSTAFGAILPGETKLIPVLLRNGMLPGGGVLYGGSSGGAVIECGSPLAGSCCMTHITPKCNDEQCCTLVCGSDPFCCTNQWDFDCAMLAREVCDLCIGAPGNPGGDGSQSGGGDGSSGGGDGSGNGDGDGTGGNPGGGDGTPGNGGGGRGCDRPDVVLRWELQCDQNRNYSSGVGVLVGAGDCDQSGGTPWFGTGGGGGGGSGGGSSGPFGSFPSGPSGPGVPSGVLSQTCYPCLDDCLAATASCTLSSAIGAFTALGESVANGSSGSSGSGDSAVGPGDLKKYWECIATIYGTAQTDDPLYYAGNAMHDCLGDKVPGADILCCLADMNRRCSCLSQPPGTEASIPQLVLDYLCGQGAFDLPSSGFMDSDDPALLPWPTLPNAAANNLNQALRRHWQGMLPFAYILGAPKYLYGGSLDEMEPHAFLLKSFGDAMLEESAEGIRISSTEAASIMARSRPSHLSSTDVSKAIERWNRTRDYWAMSWFDFADVPTGFSLDFIERERFRTFAIRAGEVGSEYQGLGFEQPIYDLANAYEVLQDANQTGQGTCVQIGIQLNQTLTLVRQAFEATLILNNESDYAIEGIDVDVVIEDLTGENRTSRFAILGPNVTGMGDANGNGQLAPGATGSAKWTIVPGDSAAPDGPTYYRVRGQFRYALNGQVLVVPLFPVTITVYPNPSLSLQYFIETQVYSDDPFTPEIEPMIPFSLGLWAKNNGGGTAGQVKIESAQPEIVSNEMGALIDFQLIGTQVNEDALSPSLLVDLGDILPGEVSVAQWLMTSTLQGEFVGYSATIQSTNGFDDPEFSVVDEAAVNPMTHVVRADEPLDDGRPDFLGNLTLDPKDLPDKIYLSSGVVEPVSAVTNASVSVVGNVATVTAPVAPGWRYIRIDDPFGASRPLESVTRSDGKEIQLGHNAWQTSYITRDTPTPEARRYVHIFDRGGDGVYALEFAIDGQAPEVVSWQVLRDHASLGALGLEVPSLGAFSESRPGGIRTLVLSFSEPLNPATFNATSVAVSAYNASGVEVTVPVGDRTAELRLGDQYATVTFPTPLPNGLRYCIRLLGVRDLAGNLLDQGSGGIDLALVPGDVTGDLRVTVNDAGAIGSLLGQTVDPLDPYLVRADLNLDGTITMADASLVVAAIGTDLRFAINPCSNLGDNRILEDGDGDGAGDDLANADDVAAHGGRPWGGSVTHGGLGRRPSDGRGDGRGDVVGDGRGEQVVLSRDGESVLSATLRGDVIAVRGLATEDLLEVLGLYRMELVHPPAEGDAVDVDLHAWTLARLPAMASTPASVRWLALMLEGEGVEAAAVAELAGGALVAVLPEVEIAFVPGVPANWIERLMPTLVPSGSWKPVGQLGALVDLRPLFGAEVHHMVRVLSARREFALVRCRMEPIGGVESGDSGSGVHGEDGVIQEVQR